MKNQSPAIMNSSAFAALFDHTLLKPEATLLQVQQLVEEALTHGFKGVCVNPCYVSLVAKKLGSSQVLPIAVVGFPLGANRTDIKIDEVLRAIGEGAREIDMVINSGYYRSGDKAPVRHEIAAIVRAAQGVPVKVIIETAYLAPSEIQELCLWSAQAGAAFVKTSTGYSPRGATVQDIVQMRAALVGHPDVQIKASGGIRTLEAVLAMVAAGADRIGSSSSVAILADFNVARHKD